MKVGDRVRLRLDASALSGCEADLLMNVAERLISGAKYDAELDALSDPATVYTVAEFDPDKPYDVLLSFRSSKGRKYKLDFYLDKDRCVVVK